MRRFTIRLYMIYLAIFMAIFALFSVAYILIADTYVSDAGCNNLALMSRNTVVTINQQVTNDFDSYKSAIDKIMVEIDQTAPIDVVKYLNKNRFSIEGIDDYQYAYIDGEVFYSGYNHYNINKTDNRYFLNAVGIYRFSEILTNYPDTSIYVVFRYKNILTFFKCEQYLDKFISDVDGMPDNYYMIVSSDGDVVYQEDNTKGNRIYTIYSTTIDTEYEKFISNLNTTSYNTLRIDGENSFLVHTPILQSLAKYQNVSRETYNAYSLVYIFTKQDIIKSNSYLTTALLISFIAMFVIINLGLFICLLLFLKKEQDMSSSKLRYFFAKPYVAAVTKKGKLRYFNRTFLENFKGVQKVKNAADFTYLEEVDDIAKFLRNQTPLTLVLTNNEEQTMYIRFIPMKAFVGYILLGEDITAQKQDNDRNREIALYNNVTKLPNKLLLDESIQDVVSNNRGDTTICAIDVVDFIKINSMFGFETGDSLLKASKEILEKSLEGYKYKLFNIRTSFFVAIIYEERNLDKIMDWTRLVEKLFSNPIEVKKDFLMLIEYRIGIYQIPKEDDLTAKGVFDYVSIALERAKNSRLTRSALYNAEFGKMLNKDQIMEQDLFKAVQNRDFMMFYQPQYNTKRGKIIGFEALVRWNDPKYRFENPEHYIKIAERNGLIVSLGNIIIEETFKFAKSIENTGISISINVSPAQLLQSGFINTLINYFEGFELKKGAIAVEITETFLMENKEVMIEKLKILKDNGFEIHLDDFGQGYSSLMYLRDLPVDTIKIDKDFTKEMVNDKYSRAIVTRIVQMALGLDLSLIAEGVEDEKQMNALSRMGCDVIQGYLISKPVSEDATLDLINKYNGKFDMESKPIVESVKKKIKQLQEKKEKLGLVNSEEKNSSPEA